jgi:ribosomal protein S18 acetylase RimI-like enzyme
MITAQIGPVDESILRDFLFHAIFVPDGEQPLDRNVLELPEISKYMDNWGRDGDFGLKLLHKNRAIGAIWCRLFPAEEPGYGFVREDIPELTMAILPEYRNRGLGLRLYRDFEELLIRQQIRGLSLSVDKRNPATRFYLKAGLKVFREEETAFVMIRHLPGS